MCKLIYIIKAKRRQKCHRNAIEHTLPAKPEGAEGKCLKEPFTSKKCAESQKNDVKTHFHWIAV